MHGAFALAQLLLMLLLMLRLMLRLRRLLLLLRLEFVGLKGVHRDERVRLCVEACTESIGLTHSLAQKVDE
jgi:hypothetical protein